MTKMGTFKEQKNQNSHVARPKEWFLLVQTKPQLQMIKKLIHESNRVVCKFKICVKIYSCDTLLKTTKSNFSS